MRWYEWSQLRPGMKVAKPVYARNRLILTTGKELNWSIIQKLPIWGIFHLMVDSERHGPTYNENYSSPSLSM